MSKLIENRPSAKVLMNSMRSMGYTFESALADVIDNSISANCTEIQISFPKDAAHCYVSICDNGIGMDSHELFEAMKYGSLLGGEIRKDGDLGRFGLGLKSASLSQCKKLTVVSYKNRELASYIWDLDEVGADWYIQECNQEEIKKIIDLDKLLNYNHGTLVIWEEFDLIEKSTGDVYTTLLNEQTSLSNYLELIFHRYINGDDCKKIDIRIGEYSLKALDPFLVNHKKTKELKKKDILIEDSMGVTRNITVTPYVLPFQKDISKSDMVKLGGLENYQTKQGFYIYRNKRLIIWGTWFRMKSKNDLFKHARIKVDIPNSLDDIWGIDIKKQTAILPLIVRNQLVKAVEDVTESAVKSQKYRGRVNNINDNIDYVWDRLEAREKKYKYIINRNSRVFDLIEDIDDESKQKVEMLIEEIERNIPYQQIYIDMCDRSIDDQVDDERIENIKNKAIALYNIAIKVVNNKNEVIENIINSEPFVLYKEKIKNTLMEL